MNKSISKKQKLNDIQNNNLSPLERMYFEGMNQKKIKKIVDKNAPKRSMSSFLFFSQVYRPLFHQENPTLKNTDISTMLSEKWKVLTTEEKKPYLDAELAERTKYHKNMKVYKDKKNKSFQSLSVNQNDMKTHKTPPLYRSYDMMSSNFSNEWIYNYSSKSFPDNLSNQMMIPIVPFHTSSSSSSSSSSSITDSSPSVFSESFCDLIWGINEEKDLSLLSFEDKEMINCLLND